jgi:hypothetical protein
MLAHKLGKYATLASDESSDPEIVIQFTCLVASLHTTIGPIVSSEATTAASLFHVRTYTCVDMGL